MGKRLRVLALSGAITLASILALSEEASSTAGKTPTIQIGMWNKHRVEAHRLPRWSGYSPTLSRIACRHAERMATSASGNLFHTNITPYIGRFSWVGQVVGFVTAGPTGTAPLFKAYHNSPSHRAVWEVRRTVYIGDCAVKDTRRNRWYHVANFMDPA
jgi:hypothetical protein